MKIDHIGYAVKNLEKAKKAMEALGYTFQDSITDHDRNIYIAFGEMNGYRVELVSPISAGSPIDAYLSRIGSTPYHICYSSTDLEADMEKLKQSRFKVQVPPAPAIAFGGKRVVFLNSLSVGLIELVEE